MEDIWNVKILIALLFLLVASSVFAYDNDTTHPYLTGKAVDLFEQSYGSTFSSTEKKLIVQGSIDEDAGVRWLQHFYDPINKVGLFVAYETSKSWARDLSGTKNYFAWETAIYDYSYGDKNQGLLALGHILHLLQDKTVPDHTRDDPHPIRSTYESFSKNDLPVLNTSPVILSSLNAYFDAAANFSNNNFFSDDTILRDYVDPKVLKEVSEKNNNGVIIDYGYGNYGKLVTLKKWWDNSGSIHKDYSLEDTDNKVMTDYWNTLSPKAVGYSAGAIKLFLAEVAKEKQTGAIKLARRPWWQKLTDLAKTNLGQALAAVRLARQTEATKTIVAVVGSDTYGPTLPATPNWAKAEADLVAAQTSLDTLVDDDSELKVLPIIHSINNIFASLPTEITAKLAIASVPEMAATSTGGAILAPPVVLTPVDFSTPFASTTIVFSGTAASATAVFIVEISSASTTVATDGTWTLPVTFSSIGTTTLNFVARNNSATSTSATITLAISSSTVRETNVTVNLSSPDCDPIFNQEHCLVLNKDSASIAWSVSPPGDYHYKLIKFADWWSDYQLGPIDPDLKTLLSEADSPYLLAKPDSADMVGLELEIYDQNNQLIASTTKDFWFMAGGPIWLNEIGWAGTSTEASSGQGDEWLELASRLPFPLSLVNLKIKSADGLVDFDLPAAASINAAAGENLAYYLIERKSDDVITDVPADLVVPFSATDDGTSDLLTNTGFSLKLARSNSDPEQILDATPFFSRECETRMSLPDIPPYELCWPDPHLAGTSIERRSWLVEASRNQWQMHWENQSRNGHDRNGVEIWGTPGQKNTLAFFAI